MPAQRGASVPGCGMFYRHIPACGDQCPALALGWPCENDTQAVSEMIMASIFHAVELALRSSSLNECSGSYNVQVSHTRINAAELLPEIASKIRFDQGQTAL